MRSTLEQQMEFKDTNICKDLMDELEVWKDMAVDEMSNPTATHEDDLVNKGRIDACRRMLQLPETMSEDAEIALEQSASDKINEGGNEDG